MLLACWPHSSRRRGQDLTTESHGKSHKLGVKRSGESSLLYPGPWISKILAPGQTTDSESVLAGRTFFAPLASALCRGLGLRENWGNKVP